jgi:hypothetical protein
MQAHEITWKDNKMSVHGDNMNTLDWIGILIVLFAVVRIICG